MTIKTDSAGENRGASVEASQSSRATAPPAQGGGAARDPQQAPSKSFAEVLRGKEAQGAAHAAGAASDPDGERGGFGDALEKPRRSLSIEADESGAFAAFRIPPSILQRPADIARPTLERSGVASAAQAIADRVVETVRIEANPSGRLEFVMETKADVLGGAEIRVRVEDGRVHATFASARPEVRAVLESQAGALRDALVARGLSVGEVVVTEPSRKQHHDDARDDSRHGGSRDSHGGSRGSHDDEPSHDGRRNPNR